MEFTPARPSKGGPIVSSTPVGDGASHDSGYASFVFQKPQHDHDFLQVDSPDVESGQNPSPQSLHDEDSLLNARTPKSTTVNILRVCPRSTLHKRRDQQGRLHVDFLRELRPFEPILVKLLSMLEDRDLAAICRTSATWRNVCFSIKTHATRWRRYIRAKRNVFEANRENLPEKRFHRERAANAEPLSTVNSVPTLLAEKEEGGAQRRTGQPWDVSGRGFSATDRTSRPVVSPVPCDRKQSVGSRASKRNLRRL